MDYFMVSAIAFVFVFLPLYLRSDLLTILGALTFGWVINDITGAELFRIGTDILPDIAEIQRLPLAMAVLGPAALAIWFTKSSSKSSSKMVLYIGLAPAIVIIGWKLLLNILPREQSRDLLSGDISIEIARNQDYALWLALFMFIVLLAMSKKPRSKDDKSKKK